MDNTQSVTESITPKLSFNFCFLFGFLEAGVSSMKDHPLLSGFVLFFYYNLEIFPSPEHLFLFSRLKSSRSTVFDPSFFTT